ncbi:hypothetical protein [Sporosarcina sp. P19]|uniref:hypothetical protein n=1 Tax=Sporosarcina sp. P19 TaxID=2048258 RepID=UPI0013042ABB|nr:hypothetical protein [Sporosarcina sp. P19]
MRLLKPLKKMDPGMLTDQVVVDAIQGGKGTSLYMNINESLANRAIELYTGYFR